MNINNTWDLSTNFKMSSCDCLKRNQSIWTGFFVLRLSLSFFNSLFSVIGTSLGPAANPRQGFLHSSAINYDYCPNNCLKLYFWCSGLCSLNLPQCPLAKNSRAEPSIGSALQHEQTNHINSGIKSTTSCSLSTLRQLKHITRKESRKNVRGDWSGTTCPLGKQMSKEIPEKAAHTFVNVTIRDRAILGALPLDTSTSCIYGSTTLTVWPLHQHSDGLLPFFACVHPVMYCIWGIIKTNNGKHPQLLNNEEPSVNKDRLGQLLKITQVKQLVLRLWRLQKKKIKGASFRSLRQAPNGRPRRRERLGEKMRQRRDNGVKSEGAAQGVRRDI